MFFLSQTKIDSEILVPRAPLNSLTEHGYEDGDTPRVCGAPSINQCIMALSAALHDTNLYVYELLEEDGTVSDKYIVPLHSQVPDCEITGEVWFDHPMKLKYVGVIHVIKPYGPGYKYHFGENDRYQAILYDWEYEWVS